MSAEGVFFLWMFSVMVCSLAFFCIGWCTRDKWLRAEAVMAGSARWVAAEDGTAAFEWVTAKKEEPCEES